MASKRRSRTVEILPLRTSRRAAANKSSRPVKKAEDKKLISETPKVKNVIREIEKPKQVEDEKPRESKKTFGKQPKQKKVHKCEICLKIFKGLNDLRKHLRIHSDERPYECTEPECGKRFRQAGCLKNHIASQHGKSHYPRFCCDMCGKTFPVKERLRLHLRIHSGEKPYQCDVCQKTFARGGQLSQHTVTHTGIKKYKCDYCSSKFSCLANLKIHHKSHRDERDFVCHICSKAFYRRDALKKHISCYHENIKAFHCKICNKMFKGHLPQHMRTHQSIKTHGCLTCGALFSQRSQLIVHQRIHSGERPYRCQICLQAFAHSSVLKLHIRKHTGEKPFKCPMKECKPLSVAFSQLPHLKKHMLSIHGKEKPYMCESCNDFYKTKQDLQTHSLTCSKNGDVLNELAISDVVKYHRVDPPMPLEKMRLTITILFKKISNDKKLKELGFEKRLIDNVLIDSLKIAGRKYFTDEDRTFSEAERLKLNVEEFLDWTIPSETMEVFKKDSKSTEEILDSLSTAF